MFIGELPNTTDMLAAAVTLNEVKKAAKSLDEAFARLQAAYCEAIEGGAEPAMVVIDDVPMRCLRVQQVRTTFPDAKGFIKALSEAGISLEVIDEFTKTETKVVNAPLEKALAAGEVPADVVSTFAKITPSSPFVRFEKVQEEEQP
jgi:hypothetical protein